MFKFAHSEIVKTNIDKVFNIIINVEDYSSFIPWCKSVEVLSADKNEIKTKVNLKCMFFEKSYESITKYNIINKDKEEQLYKKIDIDIFSDDEIFTKMESKWSIVQLKEEETKVDFSIELEFLNDVYNTLLKPFFSIACDKIMKSFLDKVNYNK